MGGPGSWSAFLSTPDDARALPGKPGLSCGMDPMVAVDILEAQASAFADLVAGGDLGAPVAACPGWSLWDLACHLGGVHRWAHQAVLSGPSDRPTGPPGGVDLLDWFQQGAAGLVETLRATPPDMECWTFAEPRTARFWMRRQAHETALHRWDAQTGLGQSCAIDDALAEDGIDEVVSLLVPGQVRLGRIKAGPERIELVLTSGGRYLLATEPSEPNHGPSATVAGSAEDVLLLLWGRVGLEDRPFEVSGEASALDRLLSQAITP